MPCVQITAPKMRHSPSYERSNEHELQPQITGQLIGRLRTQKGMSQEVLSGLAGVARSHLAMIENGHKNANVDTLWRISAALGIRMSQLMQMVEAEIARQESSTPGKNSLC